MLVSPSRRSRLMTVLTSAILGILLTPPATAVDRPLGFLGAMGGVATAIDDLGQCAAP
jgi:hypothetical protein